MAGGLAGEGGGDKRGGGEESGLVGWVGVGGVGGS